MAVVINTNVDALKIQNVLTNSTNKLSSAMQRMSSGLKINSAKDDAAGTVISARMNVQLDGNKICQNNVQNANALLSTAEGNVDVVLENITRIRDLTLEAKNGTYSAEEKDAMQQEVDQRIQEINRISNSAKYSQLQLFGDSLASGVSFQVGANSDANNVISADGSLFSSVAFEDIVKKAGSETATDSIGAKYTGALTEAEIKTATTAANVGNIYYNKNTGVFNIITQNQDGSAKAVEYTAATKFTDVGTSDATTTKGALSKKNGVFYVGNGTGADELTGFNGQDVTTADGKIYATNPFNLKTMTAGTGTGSYGEALDCLDKAIDDLTNRKSKFGSLGNRLNSALDTLTTQYANLTSAKSIITDADIADEASKYTQNQILQQVSTSLLAQANQSPSIALSLL